MSENKNKEKKDKVRINVGGIHGSQGINFGDIHGTYASGVTVYNTSSKKICKICQEKVGLNHPNNCQCEKWDTLCEYCQDDSTDKEDCCCRRKGSGQKEKTKPSIHSEKKRGSLLALAKKKKN